MQYCVEVGEKWLRGLRRRQGVWKWGRESFHCRPPSGHVLPSFPVSRMGRGSQGGKDGKCVHPVMTEGWFIYECLLWCKCDTQDHAGESPNWPSQPLFAVLIASNQGTLKCVPARLEDSLLLLFIHLMQFKCPGVLPSTWTGYVSQPHV